MLRQHMPACQENSNSSQMRHDLNGKYVITFDQLLRLWTASEMSQSRSTAFPQSALGV